MVAILPNFPMKNQLTEPTKDGHPPENARYDCVPTSFAAAIQYLTGRTTSGDELKDAEYGETYANAGTALWRYVDQSTDRARAVYGCDATPYNSTNTHNLTAQIHKWLEEGFPVIGTIPSQWGTAHDQATLAHPNFSSHVICFYSEEGGLTAMNPWGGFKHTGSDTYWQGRLCYAQVWKVFKESEVMPVLQVGQTFGLFTQDPSDAGRWHCPNTNIDVNGAILEFYRSLGGMGMGAGGLSLFGLPVTHMLAPDSAYQGRIQFFEKGVIAWDPSNKWDKPAGYSSGNGCYCPHIDKGWAHNYILGPSAAQLDDLKKQLTAAQDQNTTLENQSKDLETQVASLKAQLENAAPPLTQQQQEDLSMAAALRQWMSGT